MNQVEVTIVWINFVFLIVSFASGFVGGMLGWSDPSAPLPRRDADDKLLEDEDELLKKPAGGGPAGTKSDSSYSPPAVARPSYAEAPLKGPSSGVKAGSAAPRSGGRYAEGPPSTQSGASSRSSRGATRSSRARSKSSEEDAKRLGLGSKI